jgi:phage major head subunit gpT-like protein
MAQVTPDFLAALFTNYRVIWEQEFLAASSVYQYERLCTTNDSNTLTENYSWLGTVPKMQEWIDQRQVSALAFFNYAITNKHFEASIEVDRDTIEDDQYGMIRTRVAQLGMEAARFPSELVSKTLGAGASNACYDGANFFSASHTEEGLANQTNLATGTGTTLAQVRADLISARTQMRRFKDGKGRVMNVRADVAVIPADLEDVFEQLIHTNLIATGSQMMDNTLHNAVDIIVDATLADWNPSGHADDWYLLCTKLPVRPLIFQWRKRPELVSLDNPDNSDVFNRRRFKYGVDMRCNVGYGMWQTAVQVVN